MEHAHDSLNAPGYETNDAHARPIAIAGVAVVVVMALVFGLSRVMMSVLESEQPVAPRIAKEEAKLVAEEAKLEDNPFTDVYSQKSRLRRAEAKALGEYVYDKQTGVVVIPIDRAMNLIAQRGVPKGKGPKTEADVIRRGHEPK